MFHNNSSAFAVAFVLMALLANLSALTSTGWASFSGTCSLFYCCTANKCKTIASVDFGDDNGQTKASRSHLQATAAFLLIGFFGLLITTVLMFLSARAKWPKGGLTTFTYVCVIASGVCAWLAYLIGGAMPTQTPGGTLVSAYYTCALSAWLLLAVPFFMSRADDGSAGSSADSSDSGNTGGVAAGPPPAAAGGFDSSPAVMGAGGYQAAPAPAPAQPAAGAPSPYQPYFQPPASS